MVAAGDHHLGPRGGQPGERVVGQLDGVDRRQRPVVDVAGDHHEVDPLGLDRVEQVVDVRRLGAEHPDTVEGTAQVPVGGVEDAHATTVGGGADRTALTRRGGRPPSRRRTAGSARTPPCTARPARRGAPRGCEGAPTAASTPMSATTAFWTISKPIRPLTHSTGAAGDSAARIRAPTTLSTALCRPMSSRTTEGVPCSSKSPAACRPPVLSKTRCSARSRSGRPSSTSWSTFRSGQRSDALTSHIASTSSMLSVPHTPQAEEAADRPAYRSAGVRRGRRPSSTVTTLNSCSGLSVTSVQ